MNLTTAPINEPMCVSLVGVQCRSWTSLWKMPFIVSRMIKIQRELKNDPDSGFLWGMNFSTMKPFTTLYLSYWRSVEDLQKFVSDRRFSHLKSTGEYYSKFRNDSSIGIWHETYEVHPGQSENLYYGMPPFGASGFLKTISVEKNSKQFVNRIRGKNEH